MMIIRKIEINIFIKRTVSCESVLFILKIAIEKKKRGGVQQKKIRFSRVRGEVKR